MPQRAPECDRCYAVATRLAVTNFLMTIPYTIAPKKTLA
jgi:hypothetical protein